MSKKISQLPAAVIASATDQHEVNKGGVSQRLTNAQVATYIEGALSNLILGTGIELHATGSAAFATGAVQIASDGTMSFGSGTTVILPDGSVEINSGGFTANNSQFNGNVGIGGDLSVGGGLNQLLADGSAVFANNLAAIDTFGNVSAASFTVNGGVAQLAPDGSASFASSVVIFAADGSLTIAGSGGELDFQAADGILRASGGFGVGPSVGVTQDVLISGTTLHFTGGILTSVT